LPSGLLRWPLEPEFDAALHQIERVTDLNEVFREADAAAPVPDFESGDEPW